VTEPLPREEEKGETQGETGAPSRTLAAPDPEAALRNAFALWAERNTRTETLARAERLKDKVSAVTSFFDFAGKHPGDVTHEDVSRWRAEMERRGLKPATVYARVSRLSAFYHWLMSDPRLSHFIGSNPAAQARPRYPHPYQSESTKALSDDEMNALLGVVRRLADSGSVVGKRDYALLLFYFLTGLRRSEVIGLRGNDLEIRDGSLIIKYRRKGGKFTAREVSDPSVLEALSQYLTAAGRGNVIGSERPLWTRHDRAGKSGAPLTSRAFVENLSTGHECGGAAPQVWRPSLTR
jgi:integrase